MQEWRKRWKIDLLLNTFLIKIQFCCWRIGGNIVFSSKRMFLDSVPVLGFKLIPRNQLVDISWLMPPPHGSAWGRAVERWGLPKYSIGSWQFLCIIVMMQHFMIQWVTTHNLLCKIMTKTTWKCLCHGYQVLLPVTIRSNKHQQNNWRGAFHTGIDLMIQHVKIWKIKTHIVQSAYSK